MTTKQISKFLYKLQLTTPNKLTELQGEICALIDLLPTAKVAVFFIALQKESMAGIQIFARLTRKRKVGEPMGDIRL